MSIILSTALLSGAIAPFTAISAWAENAEYSFESYAQKSVYDKAVAYLNVMQLLPDAEETANITKGQAVNCIIKSIGLEELAMEGAAYSIYGMNGNDMVKPQLILGYPKIPVELDTISLKLPASTKEDLKLPVKGGYGSDIEWYSYDESVISSDGKVNAGIADEDFAKEDKVVKLRATVTEGGETREKEIEVRAVRKGVMDPVKDTYINEEVNYADDETIVFGGNSGHYAFIDFDISSDKEYIQKSRKTVLKVYATKENAGEDIELSCITDSTKKNCDIDDISYDTAKQLAEAETKFKLASKINSDGYALFDVTEYVMGLTDERALFSLEASGKRVFLYSTDGSAIYAPKLISSDTEYSDEYGANRVAEELLFEDISNYAWAREYINKLERGNIISGKEEGKFYPQDNIKHEEMAKILVLAFDIEAGPRNEEFSDVVQGSWYEEYVYTLVSSGGAKGMGNSMFGTGQNITRQDAFKMLTSVLGTNTAQYNKAQFNDSDAIADYASESVNALYAMGIISGDDNGCINPDSYITRAEAAKVICLAMEYAGN